MKAATSLDEVSLVVEAHDIPPVAKMYELVLEEAKKNWRMIIDIES
jgi:hypothetical protein